MVKRIIAVMIAAVMLVSCIGVCIAERPNVLLGDADMDNQIKLSDCSLICKYIANWDIPEEAFSEENADVNMDGKITLSDVSCILQKMINYWNP